MKKVVILGASGSVGSQTLDILLQHPQEFEVLGLSVGDNIEFLKNYLDKHFLKYACVKKVKDYECLVKQYSDTLFFHGDDGLLEMSKLEGTDIIMNALQGFVGLLPTLNAIDHHIDLALANKESLVAAGDLVMNKAKENNVNIIPVDSEHSAIFQCLNGNHIDDLKRVIITASGGAFKKLNRNELENVTVDDALKHPRWHMGHKITIDSASMMNKGFEVIEAHVLFNLPYDKIDVILHPESIVHSMVEFNDHTVMAQLASADMRIPIQYSLTYPERIFNNSDSLDLEKIASLNFSKLDFDRFPLVKLAYDAGKQGGNMLAILNGANETAVNLFIEKKIKFLDIERINIRVVELGQKIFKKTCDLQDIIAANDWAVNKALEIAKELS